MKILLILTITILNFSFYIRSANAEINNRQTYLNAVADYLAGLNENSKEHMNLMNELWEQYKKDNLNKLINWQLNHIEDTYPKACHVFYPFSGPDIVHVLSFFPNCSKYTLVGLEAVGNINNLDFSQIDLVALRTGLFSLLKKSFFVTREMWTDFKLNNRGVTLPLLALIKRMGYELIDVNPLYLNKDGNVINVIQGHNNGIRFIIKANNSEEIKEIFYFRASVANSNDSIIKHISQQENIVTYLKAAQYALFSPEFSNLRNHILQKSKMVLQDDSGIPYKYFNNNLWQIDLYGKYNGTYGESFKAYTQPDLHHRLRNEKNEILPFNLGYGYKKTTSFLMKMNKKTQE